MCIVFNGTNGKTPHVKSPYYKLCKCSYTLVVVVVGGGLEQIVGFVFEIRVIHYSGVKREKGLRNLWR